MGWIICISAIVMTKAFPRPRFHPDHPEYRVTAAKMLARTTATTTGVPLFRETRAQEIGMVETPEHWGIETTRSVHSLNYHRRMSTQMTTISNDAGTHAF